MQVLNKREDSYHNIQSIFVEIDLEDVLVFHPLPSFQLSAEGVDVPVDESNLIFKAYQLIRSKTEKVDTEYAIHLIKQIPIGGGLGGGSSNAAATLNALNNLWELNFSLQELEKMGVELGADVSFFIKLLNSENNNMVTIYKIPHPIITNFGMAQYLASIG